MIVSTTKIQEAIDLEYENAMCRGPYNSPHEAYAVTKEELEEALAEIDKCIAAMTGAWENVKLDAPASVCMFVRNFRNYSQKAAEELCQVAACCEKWLNYYAGGSEDERDTV